MRILFLTLYSRFYPSTRFRIYQYLDCLENDGIEYRVCPALPEELEMKLGGARRKRDRLLALGVEVLNRVKDILKGRSFDLVMVQKGLTKSYWRGIEGLLFYLSKNVVFDFDDAIYSGPPETFRNRIMARFQDREQINKIIAGCRGVIAGNRYLEQYARRYNDRVEVIPTPIDTDRYFITRRGKGSSRSVVIGWSGSRSTNIYLNEISGVLSQLGKKFPITLRIISNDTSGMNLECFKGVKIEFRKWDLATEVSELQELDIGVMPLPDNEWTRGKCGLKALQYMAVGVPAVCSPVGVNSEIIQDGVNGLLASSPQEWLEKLGILVENPDLRVKLGLSGRETVEKKYSVRANYPRFKKVLEKASGLT